MTKFRNILLALCLVSVSVPYSFSQTQFGLGLRTGIDFSTISFDPEAPLAPTVTKSGLTTFVIGAVAELQFAGMFAAEIEPRYILKGIKYESGAAKQTVSTSQLELPLHFKVKFLKGSVRPFAFVGPNLGIVLTAKSKLEGTGNDGETDLKNTTSSTDFGLDFGGGAEFKVASNIAITGDVRYTLGLSNLDTTPGITSTTKTRGFQILFGALFLL